MFGTLCIMKNYLFSITVMLLSKNRGYKLCGKNTIFDFLTNEFNYPYVLINAS